MAIKLEKALKILEHAQVHGRIEITAKDKKYMRYYEGLCTDERDAKYIGIKVLSQMKIKEPYGPYNPVCLRFENMDDITVLKRKKK